MRHLFSLNLLHDQDVVTARQRAADLAALLGFDISDQTRVATSVSEIVRNAFRYAGGGSVQFAVDGDSRPQRLVVEVRDHGKGIPHLHDVLAGKYRSATGLGIGIMGARRLMDRVAIQSTENGTTVLLEKCLPSDADLMTAERARRIAESVQQRRPAGLLEEVQRQNLELMRTLDDLQRKQQELLRLNRELEDTNRGVVALYAELDEKADHLRRADDLKSRFLSNMSHEFRTPVNSIIGLCNLMMDDLERAGRDVGPELVYIRTAAEQLSELVNDLLDLAKVEAGKTVVRPIAFDVQQLFGALRGMLRPLLLNQSVVLVFEDTDDVPLLHTDEGKVSQILRNLISNALKFTERGEVRVSARADPQGGTVTFSVADTGIGIAPEDQERIFEEFAQLEHRLQRRVRGTGLGLPLSKRLAELLGGAIAVRSEPGAGSTFTVTLPVHYRSSTSGQAFQWIPEPEKLPLLVIDDADDSQYFFEKALSGSAFQIYPAQTLEETERAFDAIHPAAIILDIVLAGHQSWDLLVRLKREQPTIPILVVSALPEADKARALGADAYLMKPVERRILLDTLDDLRARMDPSIRVLIVDDQEVARFLLRQYLSGPAFEVTEAETGREALRNARATMPDVVVLDLVMPDVDGREVLRELRRDAATSAIPVVIATATDLEPADKRLLLQQASAVLSKAELTQETLRDAVRAAHGRSPQGTSPRGPGGPI
jgi:signal transduction histidine kinase/CheY-like chemotaxis protein